MLTDIFAYRYAECPMWDTFKERDRRFIVQAFKIVEEQLYAPSYANGKENAWADKKWKLLNDKLSTELGCHELSKRYYTYPTTWQGNTTTSTSSHTWHSVCKNFVCADYQSGISSDIFIKERLSFVEIAFRERGNDVAAANANLPREILEAGTPTVRTRVGIIKSRSDVDRVKANNQNFNNEFNASVDELNTRLRQARYGLNYHNGFIQIAADEKVEEQIERPFWALVADPIWNNVDHDMKEALDHRDSGGRDPAWYAAMALESTCKIISKEKGWNHGGEKGAASYIDNLAAKNHQFIKRWESELMRQFFTHVRNPLGHGAGSDEMPKLTSQQTNWAIEFCMSWVKSLIERL